MREQTDVRDVFRLPDLGEGLREADLIEWCVKVGDRVEENDVLAKMETAKAVVDVPSPRTGIIAQLHGKPGETIAVGSPLVTYREESDAGSVVGALPMESKTKPMAAPAVRRLAREMGVEIERVDGTGIGGRITEDDVTKAGGVKSNRPDDPPPSTANSEAQRIPFRGVRRTIAEHLRYSVSHAVHFTVMDEADVTELETLRRKMVVAANEKISLLPFVVTAVCRVLMQSEFTRLNATVDDDREEILLHSAVQLGIATETEAGLMVPVIRDAQKLGVLQISRQIAEMAAAARDRSILPHRLSGSTFTISNFGAYAGRFGTPIINYPEAAILAVGRARDGVVVRGGMLGVGRVLPLSLAADHRVVDSATAAAALAKMIELLQSPDNFTGGRNE